MRLPLALVIAVAIAAPALFVVTRDERTQGASAATLVGDSLDVGTEPYLRSELRGWKVDVHDRVGRPTAEGVEVLRALGGRLSPIVVVSLGTNDADGTEAAFRRLVDEALEAAGPETCVVWVTIVRDGEPRHGFNDVLVEAAETHANLHLVDWASLVESDPTLLAGDLVHGSPFGYARRAQETARVVRECSP